MSAIHSRKYLDGAKGSPCTLRIVGVCQGGTDTTVPAHIRDRHTGKGAKASDISVADACWSCHDVFDRRSKMPNGQFISDEDWHFYALRGLQETQEARHARGLLIVPEDVTKSFSDRATKPRKPPAARAKIIGRSEIHSAGFDKTRTRKFNGTTGPSAASRRSERNE